MAALAPSEERSQTGEGQPWAHTVSRLFPFHIDRFTVRDGELHLESVLTDPEVDLFVDDFWLEVRNLSNVRESARSLVATAEAAGRPFGAGELEARLHFDPLAQPLRFDLDAELRRIPVVELNDLFQAYGKVDAEGGEFSAFVELAAARGRVEGYVKTLFEGLEILSFDEVDDPGEALELLWEGLVNVGAEILENQPHDRLATRIPLRGELGDARTDLVAVALGLLRNALVSALRPSLDHTIRVHGLTPVEEERT